MFLGRDAAEFWSPFSFFYLLQSDLMLWVFFVETFAHQKWDFFKKIWPWPTFSRLSVTRFTRSALHSMIILVKIWKFGWICRRYQLFLLFMVVRSFGWTLDENLLNMSDIWTFLRSSWWCDHSAEHLTKIGWTVSEIFTFFPFFPGDTFSTWKMESKLRGNLHSHPPPFLPPSIPTALHSYRPPFLPHTFLQNQSDLISRQSNRKLVEQFARKLTIQVVHST